MSVIIDKISVAKPVVVDGANKPLDARTRCNNVDDFPNIEAPFIGMLIYTIDDGKFWVVTKLKSKLIGSMAVEDMAIAEYEEFSGGGGNSGGTEYIFGEGFKVTENNVTVNFDVVAKKSDMKTYKQGTGIEIKSDGTINCTVTAGESIQYSAGNGLKLTNNEFSVDFETVAKKSDIDSAIGNINSILDNINGEVI